MGTCGVAGCSRLPKHRGWCGMHYQRWAKYGDPSHVQKIQVSRGTFLVCVVESCISKPHGRGLCDTHYKAWQRKQKPEYAVWQEVKRRCHTPSTGQYADYGGRGIRVCGKWMNSFASFLNDMGPRPSKNHSIDRIDVNGDYEPGNCRWATVEEQANNKRNNVLITYRGKVQTISQWAQDMGLKRNVIRDRYYRGWSIERIFEQGVRSHGTAEAR